MKKIKILAMDVDGTLTDGKIYMGESGELLKTFSVKDGYMISHLCDYGIIPIIISGRKSKITEMRAAEININEIHQNVRNKEDKLKIIAEKYNVTFDEIAFIGDDDNDLTCVCKCGISGCPKNASDSIKENSDFISKFDGGDGAVRDFINYILQYNSHDSE